jgi:hypothetical protein
MRQIASHLTDAADGVLDGATFPELRLRREVEHRGSGLARNLRRPRDPNTVSRSQLQRARGAVRSIKEDCLNRVIPLGERHFDRTLAEFVVHSHREHNHQGLGNELFNGIRSQHLRVPEILTPTFPEILAH